MTPNPILQKLYSEHGQSPWLDNLARPLLADGTIKALIAEGVRGITSNPTIFQQSIETTDQYDQQYLDLRAKGVSNEDAYWALVTQDVSTALDLFTQVYSSSNGSDGFVSLEVSPRLAHDSKKTVADARKLATQINKSNLMIKVPATQEGLEAITDLIALGQSVNVTLIFSLERYSEVIEAYLAGLEAYEGDLSPIQSVASFFISRVDSVVDPQLAAIASDEAKALLGTIAVAQAVLAYQIFEKAFTGPRWEGLLARGANLQRPLWASTSVKNSDYSALMYVNQLVAPHTVDTIPSATLDVLRKSETLTDSYISPEGYSDAAAKIAKATSLGIDLGKINVDLEIEGVAKFNASYEELLGALERKLSS